MMLQKVISKYAMLLYLTILLIGCRGGSSDSKSIVGKIYFTGESGKAIYLTGSHTWPNMRDSGSSDPPPAFDFTEYLDFMVNLNHNFIRLWDWDLPKYNCGGGVQNASPFPWQRTGPGTATDGKPKFDLTKFDQSYFDRLRSRVIEARDRGIYVSIMLFEGYGLQFCRISSDGYPFTGNNNINGIDDGGGTSSQTLNNPSITTIQEAYIRKVVDTVNDLDNVLYEIANESGPYSTDWQYHMINYIKNYEAGKPKQHPVGMTFQYSGGSNSTLFNSPADWISPNESGGYKDNPPAADGSKIIISDTDHLWGLGGNQSWVWKSFLRGLHPIYMDPYREYPGNSNASMDGAPAIRKAMGHTLTYAEKMDLATMTPQNSLSSTSYCLANPGIEYLVYQPGSGSFTVNLLEGTYNYEWFEPNTGSAAQTGIITVNGGNQSFIPPFGGEAVFYIYKM